jgi:hypothetical protein
MGNEDFSKKTLKKLLILSEHDRLIAGCCRNRI